MKFLTPLVQSEIALFILGALLTIIAVWNPIWLESTLFWKISITLGILIILIGIVIGVLLFMREEIGQKKNNLIK